MQIENSEDPEVPQSRSHRSHRDDSSSLVSESTANSDRIRGYETFPDLMTEEEAIRYLRLDLIDVHDPGATLRRYRKKGVLRGTQVGKCVRYRRAEIEKFLDMVTQSNPR